MSLNAIFSHRVYRWFCGEAVCGIEPMTEPDRNALALTVLGNAMRRGLLSEHEVRKFVTVKLVWPNLAAKLGVE